MSGKGKDGFMFYRSFMEAANMLPEREKAALLDAVISYGLDKIEPELKTDAARVAWVLIKPILETNWQRYENGRKGGAPRGNQNARKQPQDNPEQPQDNPENNQKQPLSTNPIKIYSKDKDKDIRKSIRPTALIDDCLKSDKEGVGSVAPVEGAPQTPSGKAVLEYGKAKGIDEAEAGKFFAYYDANGWRTKDGKPVRDWRRLLASWMRHAGTPKDYDPSVGIDLQESNDNKGKDGLLW